MVKQPATRPGSQPVAPYVFLAIAVVSVVASGLLWWQRSNHHTKHGTRVVATVSKPTSTLAIVAVSAPPVWHCSKTGDNSIILSWSATGAKSVTVAVDDGAKPFLTNQAPTSQALVPGPCLPARRTYHVTAIAPDGRTVTQSATTRGV